MPPRKKRSAFKECDTVFGKIVRARGNCENCGSSDFIQCAHGFSRRYRNTRWDERNAWALCRGCHTYYTHRPIEWDLWLRETWGEDYDAMRALALSTEKIDHKALLVSLRERWEQVEAAA